jgi:hypothetical protein
MIRLIPTKLHGILDYIVSTILIFLPWVAGFTIYNGARWVMVILGILGIIYSLVTRYEAGYVGLISMQTHLIFDAVVGLFLMASPWLLNFVQYVYLPHVIAGLLILIITICTKPDSTKSPKPDLSPGSPGKPPEKVAHG